MLSKEGVSNGLCQDEEQQNIQLELDFSSALTREGRETGKEECESSGAASGTEKTQPTRINRFRKYVSEKT
jgi:hypothetical protein